MPTIRDVMTPNPACCTLDATLQEISQKMLDEDTGFIPLMENNRIIGVITDRDIIVRANAKGVDPKTALARDYGTGIVEWVTPDTPVEEAVRRMEATKIRRLLVMEKDKLVGVVSLGDLAEVTPDQAEHVLTEISKSPRTLAHSK